jgi:hypothetical protein
MGRAADFLAGCGERALAAGLKRLAAPRIRRYGTLGEVRIDAGLRAIEVEVLLHGEPEPITIRACPYEIVEKDGAHGLVVHGVLASRKWVEALAEDLLVGRFIPLPSAAALALRHLG